MIRWSSHVLDKFLAPKVSNFTYADIPDVNENLTPWLQKYFLNSALRRSYTEQMRQYVFNYLRRVEAAYFEHQHAREASLEFLEGPQHSISVYMKALYHWEAFLTQCGIAMELLAKLNGEKKQTAKKKGLSEERVPFYIIDRGMLRTRFEARRSCSKMGLFQFGCRTAVYMLMVAWSVGRSVPIC